VDEDDETYLPNFPHAGTGVFYLFRGGDHVLLARETYNCSLATQVVLFKRLSGRGFQ
jgi:hypothetical protein